jgi:hypothetical protein
LTIEALGCLSTGFGYPSDVLAKHVKLKLPTNQWFLWALVARLDPFAAAIIA